jgi:hypothetical protein
MDPKRQVLCRIDDEIPAERILVLKRAHPFATQVVFSGRDGEYFPETPIVLLAKWILAEPMKRLCFDIRRERDPGVQFVESTDKRLADVMQLFVKGDDDIRSKLSVAERNSLIFLLLESGPEPLLFPVLHRMALDIMTPGNRTI